MTGQLARICATLFASPLIFATSRTLPGCERMLFNVIGFQPPAGGAGG